MKLGFIGCGNLARALIDGFINQKICKPENIFASDKNIVHFKKYAQNRKINYAKDNSQVVEKADIIFFATKPQDILAPLIEIKNKVSRNKIVVSLAAGVRASELNKMFPQNSIVRVMASLSAKIQKGVFGIYFLNCKAGDIKHVKNIFGKVGTVVEVVSEKHIDAITAGSASGVGFVFEFMCIFEKWFLKQGFSKTQAREMSVETFLGAALLAKKEGALLSDLRNAVTSKKGTTEAGLKSMKASQLEKKIHNAISIAQGRAKELSKNIRVN